MFVSSITQILLAGTAWKRNQKMGLGQNLISLNFESNMNHSLDAKKKNEQTFTIYLVLSALAEVCGLQVLLCFS